MAGRQKLKLWYSDFRYSKGAGDKNQSHSILYTPESFYQFFPTFLGHFEYYTKSGYFDPNFEIFFCVEVYFDQLYPSHPSKCSKTQISQKTHPIQSKTI
jgi:hypothetical protein